LQASLTIIGFEHIPSVFLEPGGHEAAEFAIVVDEQDGFHQPLAANNVSRCAQKLKLM
jgi:hypothetical protein